MNIIHNLYLYDIKIKNEYNNNNIDLHQIIIKNED